MKEAKKIIFTGKVQAVCFRMTTEKIIQHLPLAGYVKNLNHTKPHDGDQVELFIQGEPKDISQAIKMIWAYFGFKHIKNVTLEKMPVDEKYTTFSIDYGLLESFRYYDYDDYDVPGDNRGNLFSSNQKRPLTKKDKRRAALLKMTTTDSKRCCVCGFFTLRSCPSCGKPLCGFCADLKKHSCDSKKIRQSVFI